MVIYKHKTHLLAVQRQIDIWFRQTWLDRTIMAIAITTPIPTNNGSSRRCVPPHTGHGHKSHSLGTSSNRSAHRTAPIESDRNVVLIKLAHRGALEDTVRPRRPICPCRHCRPNRFLIRAVGNGQFIHDHTKCYLAN